MVNNISPYKLSVFIFATVLLILFSALWLKYLITNPQMTIIARFKNPGMISRIFEVYYHGIAVGKISHADFSKNGLYTDIYIDITKNVKIPTDSIAEIKVEGIAGQKYIDIISPEKPSGRYLKNGDIIEGQTSYGLGTLEEIFNPNREPGKFRKTFGNVTTALNNSDTIVNNLIVITTELKEIIKKNKNQINTLIKDGAKVTNNSVVITSRINRVIENPTLSQNITSSAQNLNNLTSNLNKLAGSPEVQEGVKTTISGVGKIVKKTNKLLSSNVPNTAAFQKETITTIEEFRKLLHSTSSFIDTLNTHSERIFTDVEKANLVNNMSYLFVQSGLTLQEARCVLDKLEEKGLDKDLSILIMEILTNANKTIKSTNCLVQGTSDMLSKRFLLFKLLFGKPGEAFEKCKNLENEPPLQNMYCPANSGN